eukprot:TRINITY_DN14206_c0_g2_i1.p2 TRINITY_DN14206_c0_g2~~TRINITY_DN14206_c0_g2_i1.p2  ORF type:complete len:128 (+),score=14.56 TRINITY_DN14206_c0_g2_i1:440-823(+)
MNSHSTGANLHSQPKKSVGPVRLINVADRTAQTGKSFELVDESTPSDQNSSTATEGYAAGAFSAIQSFQHLKKNLKQRVKPVIDSDVEYGNVKELVLEKIESPNENRGGILQTWHKMMDSIGFKCSM